MSDKVIMPKEDWVSALDAARSKAGVSRKLLSDELAGVISGIETGITPSGTKRITENGAYDVSKYASAEVNVPTDKYDMVLSVDMEWDKSANVNKYLRDITPDHVSVVHGNAADVIAKLNNGEIPKVAVHAVWHYAQHIWHTAALIPPEICVTKYGGTDPGYYPNYNLEVLHVDCYINGYPSSKSSNGWRLTISLQPDNIVSNTYLRFIRLENT